MAIGADVHVGWCPVRLCNHDMTTAALTMPLSVRWLLQLRNHAGRGRDLN